MAIFMPAACNPWAMDHAMERLLATPKTTAVLPCKSEARGGSLEWGRITVRGEDSEVRMQNEEYKRGSGDGCDNPRGHFLAWHSGFLLLTLLVAFAA